MLLILRRFLIYSLPAVVILAITLYAVWNSKQTAASSMVRQQAILDRGDGDAIPAADFTVETTQAVGPNEETVRGAPFAVSKRRQDAALSRCAQITMSLPVERSFQYRRHRQQEVRKNADSILKNYKRYGSVVGSFIFEPDWNCPDQELIVPSKIFVCGPHRYRPPPCFVTIFRDSKTRRSGLHDGWKSKDLPFGSCNFDIFDAEKMSADHINPTVRGSLVIFNVKHDKIRDSALENTLRVRPNIEQIVLTDVRFHSWRDLDGIVTRLWAAGFRLFHKHVHCHGSDCHTVDFSFINAGADSSSSSWPLKNGDNLTTILFSSYRHMLKTRHSNRLGVKTPVWSCPDEELVGDAGDGVKWVCGVRAFRKPCVVYSLGGGATAQFENAMASLTPCDIRTIDFRCGAFYAKGVTCHKVGISTSNQPMKGYHGMKVQGITLQAFMKSLGHQKVDVLKIDIEGAENDLFKHLESTGFRWVAIGQILIEVHRTENFVVPFLEKHGFALFHEEINILSPDKWELGFVNLRCIDGASTHL